MSKDIPAGTRFGLPLMAGSIYVQDFDAIPIHSKYFKDTWDLGIKPPRRKYSKALGYNAKLKFKLALMTHKEELKKGTAE